MNNTYHITVTATQPDPSNQSQEVMSFDTSIHDNLAQLLPKVTSNLELPFEKSQAFLLGLKLLGEVIMTERAHPMMRELAPHFRAMMQVIKPKRQSS